MAVTSGPGNGFWTRDETILALDLYLRAGHSLDAGDSRVEELSAFLRSLPLHPPEKRKGSFRNPAGVAFKIGNLRSVQTGKGLKNVSAIDREVWAELGDQPARVNELAAQIRQAGTQLTLLPPNHSAELADIEDEHFAEGGATVVLHRRLERAKNMRFKLLGKRQKLGPLRCDACTTASLLPDVSMAPAAFEAHHIRPLGVSGETQTSVKDLALLCATCHRLIHRAMVVGKRWISLPEFKSLIGH
ncbi:HNH endonuclease [Caenimonas aquaedulcis]|uniref:HNH endonuclease n=1 Tax=Caenimonas aquaedulcis TaxID=2793270 RepID=A0A931H5U0_9BURK|nr:HNH endonuclease [Caenimonas aquaedulcis]MBG9389007.1 HNH endonuclease [Caenimonas aquaedulcis]